VTLTTAKLLPGVDRHGAGYRCRLSLNGSLHIETGLASADRANARILELRELRRLGLPPSAAPAERTLAEATLAFLARKQVSGRGRRLRPRGLEHWGRSCKPWLEGEHGGLPLRLLRRQRLEQTILTRAATAPTAARNELQALKAILRYAADPDLDQSILTIEPIAVDARTRRALSVDELELLAGHAPEYARRMILLLGTTGLRIGEAFTLTDERLDLHAGSALVTAELAKERLPKQVALDAEEIMLLREQLLVRAPGTRLVFPTKTGRPWRYGQFHKLVWSKATSRAGDAWRLDHDTDPFCDLTPHDLRSTAATLMRAAGFSRDEAADRLGHVDSGELLDRVYDQGDRGARAQRAIVAKAPRGLRATLRAEAGARQALTPAAAGSAAVGRGLNSTPESRENMAP
jgi:integrase